MIMTMMMQNDMFVTIVSLYGTDFFIQFDDESILGYMWLIIENISNQNG